MNEMTATRHAAPIAADWRDFLALTKPRVMRSVVFTGLCGMLAAPVALPVPNKPMLVTEQ